MRFDYETMMREAFTANCVPDKRLSEEVFCRAEKMVDGRKVWLFKRSTFYRISGVAAALVLTIGIGAVVKGGVLKHWFVSGGGHPVKSVEVNKYRAKILSYQVQKKIPHLTIIPEYFVTDGVSSYVELKIRGDESIRLDKKMVFQNFHLWSEEIEEGDREFTETVLEEDQKSNALRFAVAGHGQITKGNGTKTWSLYLTDLMDSEEGGERILEGTYYATMEVQMPDVPARTVTNDSLGRGGSITITPMGLDIKVYLPYEACETLEKSIRTSSRSGVFAVLKDGSKVYCDVEGNSLTIDGEGDEMTFGYAGFSFLKPIKPDKVKKVHIGNLGYIPVRSSSK